MEETRPIKKPIEIQDVRDLQIVESNVQKMHREMETLLWNEESIGGNARTFREGNTSYGCVAANAVIDFETGNLMSFGNSMRKLEANETKVLFWLTDFQKGALIRKSQHFILSYDVKGTQLSERATKNLEASKEKYNSQFRRMKI